MIPSINGTILHKEGLFTFPTDQLTYTSMEKISWLKEVAAVLEERLRKLEQYRTFLLQEADDIESSSHTFQKSNLLLFSINPQLTGGSYHLVIEPHRILITVGEEEGAAQALTTLYWRIREYHGNLSCVEISDSPRYNHRGFLLDCSRHFFSVETVKSMIEQGSLRKLNRLHWHLSDDQGYRIESRRFPLLNTVGSWRKEPDNEKYGGYYTWEEIREIIAYAKARGMEIIPEIDLPGHVSAMVAAYPWLSCQDAPMEVPSNSGIHPRILCVGKDETLTFVKELLTEVCELFPYPYFHIGGDEAPKDEWKRCTRCQDKIKKLGLKDEESLQAWFTQELMSFLKENGKTGIAWNESLKSGTLPDDVIIQYWAEEGADAGYCKNVFDNGRKCVFSFSTYLYLDYMPALIPLRSVYSAKEIISGGNSIPEHSILGWEGTLWTEQIPDRKRLEQMAFPRLFAVAERTWNGTESYETFLKECRKELIYLDQDQIHCFSIEEADPHGEDQIQPIIEQWKPLVMAVKNIEKNRGVIDDLIFPKLESSFGGAELEDVKRRLLE